MFAEQLLAEPGNNGSQLAGYWINVLSPEFNQFDEQQVEQVTMVGELVHKTMSRIVDDFLDRISLGLHQQGQYPVVGVLCTKYRRPDFLLVGKAPVNAPDGQVAGLGDVANRRSCIAIFEKQVIGRIDDARAGIFTFGLGFLFHRFTLKHNERSLCFRVNRSLSQ